MPVPFDDVAEGTVCLAERAYQAGTFGVGAQLYGPDGTLLHEASNAVVVDGVVRNPTAHAEFQLGDWYYNQKAKGKKLPRPNLCSIISSLDSCMMCSGAALVMGIGKVISLAPDDFAGVLYNKTCAFASLPSGLRLQAKQTFARAGESGPAYTGAGGRLLGHAMADAKYITRAAKAFEESLEKVKNIINQGSSFSLSPQKTIETTADCFMRRLGYPPITVKINPTNPGLELGSLLVSEARRARAQTAKHDAAALVDPEGNVLMVSSGKAYSPLHTAMIELTRSYTCLRSEMRENGEDKLPHIKECTVVMLMGPGQSAQDIMNLGAYGSSIEGPLPQREGAALQYILPQQSEKALQKMMETFPPFYRPIFEGNVKQVKNQALIKSVQAALS